MHTDSSTDRARGLRDLLDADVALPGDEAYGRVAPWNLAVPVRPCAVVFATTAGEHLPHIADTAIQKQVSEICGSTGRTVITVAAGQVAPAAGGGGPVQILLTGEATAVTGYDAVIGDPAGLTADRPGLPSGGRIVVRPDGHLGAVATLDDPTPVADYFAAIAR